MQSPVEKVFNRNKICEEAHFSPSFSTKALNLFSLQNVLNMFHVFVNVISPFLDDSQNSRQTPEDDLVMSTQLNCLSCISLFLAPSF